MFLKIGTLIAIGEYERVDPTTGVKKVDRSYKLHVAYPDGTVLPETIYFPRLRDGTEYAPPNLELNVEYAFPVTVRPTKDAKRITVTAMPGKLPFAAPKRAS